MYTHRLLHYFGGSRYGPFERLSPSQLKTILKPQQKPSMKSDAKIAIILNGNAKRVNQRYADRLKAIAGPNCDVFMTTSMMHADFVVQSVIDEAYDVIITGGGDGTVLTRSTRHFGGLSKNNSRISQSLVSCGWVRAMRLPII